MNSVNNIIDMTFFDTAEKKYIYTIMIILNRPILKEMFIMLNDKVDNIICADGGANRMYDDLGSDREQYLPDQIIGDFDSIRPEVLEYYKNKNVKELQRLDTDTTDLEKCLYVSLEKISTFEMDGKDLFKKYSIIFLGASGGRIDHTFSVFSQVFKYLIKYPDVREKAEFILLSKSSCSVFLQQGYNKILTSSFLENKHQGYSIIPIDGEAEIEVIEDDSEIYKVSKEINFSGSLFFRKNHSAKNIYVKINSDPSTAILYSFTTCFSNN